MKVLGIITRTALLVLLLLISTLGIPQSKVEETIKTSEADNQQIINEGEKEKITVVSYNIRAQLIPETRKITAVENMEWTNTSDTSVDSIHFHLYYNGFKDSKSTFFKESGFYKKTTAELDALQFGEIKIEEIQLMGGQDLTERMSFISPDDGNPFDKTVMVLKLPSTVAPGEKVSLKIRYILTIPQIFDRTGTKDNYYFIAQWFPKPGVLQKDGQWHCHQFHRDSEFFADYSNFSVSLTIPSKFSVGATGKLIKKEKNADNSITYLYNESNVHDFAWSASPNFTLYSDKLTFTDNREPIYIDMFISPRHGVVKDRYMDSLKYTIDFLDKHLYPYGYKRLTFIDPPDNGLGSGGMEYPTLITGFYHSMAPDSFKFPELVTIHEMIHQYFYGMVGTDEFREAWLDEGITMFWEMEISNEYFKDSASYLDSSFLKMDSWEVERKSYLSLLPLDPVEQYSWKFFNSFQYSGNVYSKAGIFLMSLKNLIGKNKMYDCLRYYCEKYKFKHPTTEDFIETFNSFMGENFNWAFDWFIRGDGKLSHAVYWVDSQKISVKPEKYRNEAVFVRYEGYFPVELLITLENGKEIKTTWRDKEKVKKIVFEDTSPIRQAVIDPNNYVLLDSNFLDNSMLLKPSTGGIKRLALKIGFLFQNILGSMVF